LLPLQHGVETLDGGDADLGDRIQLVRLHALDVVKLSERSILIRRYEFLEFSFRLLAKRSAVYKEQNAASACILDEPINEIAGGESLAATGCHLNESTAISAS